MTRSLRPAAFLSALAASGALLAGCGSSSPDDGRPIAVATAPQIDGLLQQLAGDGVQVETVVPATADVHELELRPSQVKALRGADLILRPGRENDAWAQEALDQVDGQQVDVSAGLSGTQRHWWMDPTLALKAAGEIRTQLDELDPDGASARGQAYTAIVDELEAIDGDTKACLATVPESKRKIVTDHDAAGAFAERYGLSVVGTISPGAEPEAAPSAKRVAELVRTMRRERVVALFPIAPHGSELAASIAERGGAKLGEALWADALPGATHEHEHEGEEHVEGEAAHEGEEHGHDEHADAHEGEHAETTPEADHAHEAEPTIEAAARLNAEAVAEALGATGSACDAFHT